MFRVLSTLGVSVEGMEWVVLGDQKALVLEINLLRIQGLCGQERREGKWNPDYGELRTAGKGGGFGPLGKGH